MVPAGPEPTMQTSNSWEVRRGSRDAVLLKPTPE
jgi:hypothetical protein